MIKPLLQRVSLAFTLILLSMGHTSYAACSPHDHSCQFHGAGGNSAHAGTQQVHHTKGIQTTPDISKTGNGIYLHGVWDSNASGLNADLDVDTLLPANTPGINVISSGGYPAPSDPFAGIAGEHTRHVNTDQYQITFNNNLATAIHSQDANGKAPIPTNTPGTAEACKTTDASQSCEFVQVHGYIPTGTYGVAATNYDVNRLRDPSTPKYILGATLQNGNPDDPDYIQGNLISEDHTSLDPYIVGSMNNRGDTSETLFVKFQQLDNRPHAAGVVLDDYQKKYYGKLKYSNPFSKQIDNTIFTYQNTYRDHWGVNYQDTIQASGATSTENKGLAWRRNNVYAGTNLVSVRTIQPPPLPKQQVPQTVAFTGSCNPAMQSCPKGTEVVFGKNQQNTASPRSCNPAMQSCPKGTEIYSYKPSIEAMDKDYKQYGRNTWALAFAQIELDKGNISGAEAYLNKVNASSEVLYEMKAQLANEKLKKQVAPNISYDVPSKIIDQKNIEKNDFKKYRELDLLYNLTGKTRKQVNDASSYYNIPPEVVAAALEMENAPGDVVKFGPEKREIKKIIAFYGNMVDKNHDNGLGWSEGLGNIKPTHATTVLKHFNTMYPESDMAKTTEKITNSFGGLTNSQGNIYMTAAGMRRSLDQITLQSRSSYTIKELSQAAAMHNTPAAINHLNDQKWLSSKKGQDFIKDTNYAMKLIQEDFTFERNLTFQH